jgi:hypothetical protein
VEDDREFRFLLGKIKRNRIDDKLKINSDTITLLSESIAVCQKILNQEETGDYEEMLQRLGSIRCPSQGDR